MRHLRRNSRPTDRVGIGGRVIKGALDDVDGQNALVKAPKQWAPKPIKPPIKRKP